MVMFEYSTQPSHLEGEVAQKEKHIYAKVVWMIMARETVCW